MPHTNTIRCMLLLLFSVSTAFAQPAEMKPFTIDWRQDSDSLVNLSFLLDAPAGKDGFIRAVNGHLTKPGGARFRIWGINFTAASCFPSKEDAPIVADHLARFAINCVRFHFLDSGGAVSLFVKGRDDTRALDPQQLDRFDYFVAELKKRGIYTNINLNVGRNYRKGDGVRDYEYLGLAKVLNYFDEHIATLHKEYAGQLLTHYNPYTKSEYRHEPAVAVVECVNENSLVEAWFGDRLLGKNTQRNPGTWADITAWYAEQLTSRYNEWLKAKLSPTELKVLRDEAGVQADGLMPRLTQKQFAAASDKRFHTEAAFYMELENNYFQEMYRYLKQELGVHALVVGTSDHNHSKTGYPLLTSTSQMDIVDGHVYWQHPRYLTNSQGKRAGFSIGNTPMVNEPFKSTVVQLSRSAVAGKPYTVSEINHPFPNEYACEGIAILAAYAAFQDWDGIFFYTFEHKDPKEWKANMPSHFEFRPDPVKMTNLAAGALMFLGGHVRSALTTIPRSYSTEQVREGIRAPYSEGPFFTPGFSPSIPLRHATRIAGFDKEPGEYPKVTEGNPSVSDTGELTWYCSEKTKGLVAIETDKSQALIGFVKDHNKALKNLSAEVENKFCSITLTSLDGQPISKAQRLLLVTTARAANTGMIWDDKRTSLSDWGGPPTVIEPVEGKVILRNLEPLRRLEIIPLDGAGKAQSMPTTVRSTNGELVLQIGSPATVWHLIRIER